MRGILLLIVGALLARLLLRLIRTLRSALPGDAAQKDVPLKKGKIIDAEFEDVDQDS